MENNRAKMIYHALAEAVGFVERPDSSDHVRSRAWERASMAIADLRESAGHFDARSIRILVLTCAQLGAGEAQTYAGHLASELGVDLSSVLEKAA